MATAQALVEYDAAYKQMNQVQRAEIDSVVRRFKLDEMSADQFEFNTKTMDIDPNAKFIPAGLIAGALNMQYTQKVDRQHFRQRVLEEHPLFADHWVSFTQRQLENHLAKHRAKILTLSQSNESTRVNGIPDLDTKISPYLKLNVPGYPGRTYVLRDDEHGNTKHHFVSPTFARFLMNRANDKLGALYTVLWDHTRKMLRQGAMKRMRGSHVATHAMTNETCGQLPFSEQLMLEERRFKAMTRALSDVKKSTDEFRYKYDEMLLLQTQRYMELGNIQHYGRPTSPTRSMDTSSDGPSSPVKMEMIFDEEQKEEEEEEHKEEEDQQTNPQDPMAAFEHVGDFATDFLFDPMVVRMANIVILRAEDDDGTQRLPPREDPLEGYYARNKLYEIFVESYPDTKLTQSTFSAKFTQMFDDVLLPCGRYRINGKQMRFFNFPKLEVFRAAIKRLYPDTEFSF